MGFSGAPSAWQEVDLAACGISIFADDMCSLFFRAGMSENGLALMSPED